jgi:hypothetical protein
LTTTAVREPRGKERNVEVTGFFAAIVLGLVIGALGRLVVPGKQNIPIWLTLVIGVVAAILPRRALVIGFLHAIGLPEPDRDAWLQAWQAIEDGKPVPRPANAPRPPCRTYSAPHRRTPSRPTRGAPTPQPA